LKKSSPYSRQKKQHQQDKTPGTMIKSERRQFEKSPNGSWCQIMLSAVS